MEKVISLVEFYEIESSALDQIRELIEFDCVKKIAIMPDIHTGYVAPIGTAILSTKISPALIGYDIGCGMCSIKTDFDISVIKDPENILEQIEENIPVGKGIQHTQDQKYIEFKSASNDKILNDKVNSVLFKQLGTLGSGNHFIEIGKSQDNKLTITIHSGSRRSGWEVANYYMKQVKEETESYFIDLNNTIAKNYIKDALFMLKYAFDNRFNMLKYVCKILGIKIDEKNIINESHNTFEIREDNTILHRKGATPAEKDQLGIIPGSKENGVIITIGLGNEEYLCSASHGAGRKLSRKKAKKLLDLEEETKKVKDVYCRNTESLLDEAPGAYKDLNHVISLQSGKVINVVEQYYPFINVKG